MTSHRLRRPAWIVLGAVVVVAILAAAAIVVWPRSDSGSDVAGQSTSQSASSSSTASNPDPPVATPKALIVPMKPSSTAPTAAGVTARLAKPLADKNVADLSGIVIDPVTGKTLWSADPTDPRMPASSMKIITGAALLASVDPNSRFVTKVVAGADPGTIVFVGGGDVTLSARPANAPTVLPGGPRVSDLAAQVKAAGVKVTKIELDTSYWTGPELAEGWHSEDIKGTPSDAHGYITKMSPLMVDADRVNPDNEDSPRTGTPAMTAGKALARALGVPDVPISMGTAPAGAKLLATVSSQPMSTLLAQALENSDNILADALARQVAIARGVSPSFQGVSSAILQALQDMGISTKGVVIKDGSGMSDLDRIPTKVLGEVIARAVAGKGANARDLLTGLPLAGVSGTLAQNNRFNQSNTKAGKGWVRAKTGSLETTYALVGYVPDVDGRILVFAFNSDGVSGNESRYAQDALAASLRLCGCSK